MEEIIDGKLVVSKKKKSVLVQELRDRKYEAFPPGKTEKQKSTEDELNNSSDKEDGDDETNDADARDYDYLLSVSPTPRALKWLDLER